MQIPASAKFSKISQRKSNSITFSISTDLQIWQKKYFRLVSPNTMKYTVWPPQKDLSDIGSLVSLSTIPFTQWAAAQAEYNWKSVNHGRRQTQLLSSCLCLWRFIWRVIWTHALYVHGIVGETQGSYVT